jgi:hypothetical protein
VVVVNARKPVSCTPRTQRRAAAIGLSLALVTVAPAALAQLRPSAHLELGGGLRATPPQPGADGIGPALAVTARVGVDVPGHLSLQLSGAHRRFPTGGRDATVSALTLGARFSPPVGDAVRAFIDLDLGPAITSAGPRVYAALDVGAGFEFAFSRTLSAGPVLRYSRLLAAAPDPVGDAQSVTFGLSFSFRAGAPIGGTVGTSGPPQVPVDSDHDGELDPTDECPFLPAGPNPDPARRGCPMPDHDHDQVPDVADRDHDTVPDASDACPDLPGGPPGNTTPDGCPLANVVLDIPPPLRFDRVPFEPTREVPTPLGLATLDRIALSLRLRPDVRLVRVEGHADDRLSPAGARALSRRRADAVVAWLVRHGVESTRLTAVGHGATRPLVRNWTAETRRRFNRVELVVVDPPAAAPLAGPMCPLILSDQDPVAAAMDAGVQARDRDRDAVPDARDRCPDVPRGARPDPLCPGCPAWPMDP